MVDFIYCKLADIPLGAKKFLDEQANGLEEHTVELNYDYWTTGKHQRFFRENIIKCSTVEECLRSFLPEKLREGAPTGFSMIGHIGRTTCTSCCISRTHPIKLMLI